MVDSLKSDFVLAQLKLRSFSAINHKKFVMHIDHLRGRIVFSRRCSGSTAKYGHFESHIAKKNRPNYMDPGGSNIYKNDQC